MSGYVKFERPFLIRAATGLAYYESAAFPQGIEDVWNGHATTTITRGMAVCMDTTAANITGYFPRWDYSTAGTDVNFATVCRIPVIPSASASSVSPMGVAMENIPAGATGRIITDGITAVLSSGTTVLSQYVITATGTGTVGPSATPVVGKTLGNVLVIAGTGAGTSGSATQTIIRIAPQ
jgi:hypothetical protein